MSRDLEALRSQLDERSRPRLAKCARPSLRELSEDRAAAAFRCGIEASGLSQRATARRLCVDERLVRDYLSGARALPAWAPIALPIDGQVAYLRALAHGVPDVDEDELELKAG